MALWRLFYHLVWSTKERQPMITAVIEQKLYGYMIGKADSLECITHAIGSIEDHIHIVASIPPKLAVSEYVQKIKGSSSHHVNHGMPGIASKLYWQRGYGVFSLGEKNLERAIAYVRNQKEHHRKQQLIAALERDSEEDDGPASWNHGEAIAGIEIIRASQNGNLGS